MGQTQAELTRAAFELSNKETNRRRITAHDTRHLCGGISDMTLWRWLNEEALGFPRPIYIGRRRYWMEAEVTAWLDNQSTETAA